MICIKTLKFITVTSYWVPCLLKSPASRLFAQPFVQAHIKGNIKAPRYRHLWGETTGDRRFPPHKGPVTRKCFHLMTSLCIWLCRVLSNTNKLAELYTNPWVTWTCLRPVTIILNIDITIPFTGVLGWCSWLASEAGGMVAILQTTFTVESFSSIKIVVFWFEFHWNLFQRIPLTKISLNFIPEVRINNIQAFSDNGLALTRLRIRQLWFR